MNDTKKKSIREIIKENAVSPLEILTEDKEREYLLKVKNGSIEARNEIIKHNIKMVVKLAKKHADDKYTAEFLFNVGVAVLGNSVYSYNIDSKESFEKYCSRCIENEILEIKQKTKKSQLDNYFL